MILQILYLRSDNDDTDDDEEDYEEQNSNDFSLWVENRNSSRKSGGSHSTDTDFFNKLETKVQSLGVCGSRGETKIRLENKKSETSNYSGQTGSTLRWNFNLLSNEAAKHKIAVRPRKNHPRNKDKSGVPSELPAPEVVVPQQNQAIPSKSNRDVKKPTKKTGTTKERKKDQKPKLENVKNFGFFSRLLKSKRNLKRDRERDPVTRAWQNDPELATMNVRHINYEPGIIHSTLYSRTSIVNNTVLVVNFSMAISCDVFTYHLIRYFRY